MQNTCTIKKLDISSHFQAWCNFLAIDNSEVKNVFHNFIISTNPSNSYNSCYQQSQLGQKQHDENTTPKFHNEQPFFRVTPYKVKVLSFSSLRKEMVQVHRASEDLFMYKDALIQHCYYKNCVSISLYYSKNHPFPIQVSNLSIFKLYLSQPFSGADF